MTANLNDSPTLIPLVSAALGRIGVLPVNVIADAGYDSNRNVEGILARGAEPIIKRIKRRTTINLRQKRHPRPRLIIDQESPEWLAAYSKRASVERIFARLKGHRSLARHCRRRLIPVTLHCTLAILTLQAAALAHATRGDLNRAGSALGEWLKAAPARHSGRCTPCAEAWRAFQRSIGQWASGVSGRFYWGCD